MSISEFSIDAHARDVGDAAPTEQDGGPVRVSLATLMIGRSFREGGIRDDHVVALMADPGRWAPIVVARSDSTVVDGCHRVLAGRRLGLEEIPAIMFDGDEHEVFIEFVRLNLHGGLGLTHSERQAAVRQILRWNPDWADRRIGKLCGISPNTVAQARIRVMETFDGDHSRLHVRVGRDGRARPLDAAAQRAKILEALMERPNDSLRAIAGRIGVSPETVRRVRSALVKPASIESITSHPTRTVDFLLAERRTQPQWRADLAFSSCEDGAVTAAFMERTAVSEADLGGHVLAVPLSRVYEVADEARHRAAFWSRLADCVEGRARRVGR